MTTLKNVRASISSSSGAPLALSFGQTNGESQNLSPQETAAFTVADPPYLASQVG